MNNPDIRQFWTLFNSGIPVRWGKSSNHEKRENFQNTSGGFWRVWPFEFGHNLSFWVSSKFNFLVWWKFELLCTITIWVFEFHQNLSFWVSSQFEFLSFVTIWVFKVHHNFIFIVSSQFEFLSFITIWVFKFYPNLSFFVQFFSFITIWFF